ncbi:MAG TPA: asparagine synthase-related protein [Methylomirabilota bacterium]|nr:asparagine synthase-related protein [Methylomirabilota bacterium]
MPGIAGIISRLQNKKFPSLTNAMVATMKHENFYKSETHSVPEMGIYAGAVTFENSADGIFSNDEGNLTLIFSGECFWDSEIADGKKLIQLYEHEGQKFFEKLNGLFCGLLIDKRQNKAFLFNDRYGIQRLYFHETADAFYFASEAKALLRILPELRQFDSDGLAQFLAFGCTLDWKTLFHQIEILPGGSLWTFENGDCKKGKYFSTGIWKSQPQLSADEFENRFQQTFKKILPRYFESDSKIGVALTGGLDTRMIMACRPQNNGHTTCYTFSGNTGETLDDKIAARVAIASGLEHKLLRLGTDFFSDFASHADKTVFVTDGCAGIFNAHEIYLNRLARELAPTRLTGNYGSEILRGVSTFKPVPLAPQLPNPDLLGKINSQAQKLSAHKTQPATFAAFKEVPWNLFGNLAAGRSQLHFRTPYLDNELVSLAFQAPEQIRKSSLPSFRLVRANNPALGEIPTDRGFAGDNSGLKFLSRRIFAEVTFKLDYYSTAGLPRPVSALNPIFNPVAAKLKIAGRHKFLRYSAWFRNEMAGRVSEVLSDSRVRGNGIWNPDFIGQLPAQHIGRRNDFSAEINAVLTLEAVDRLLFHELPRDF